ncbi:MAG: sigma-54 dependent transcriptional regulator [Candidatus Fermentibacteraceae bacterium]
MRRILLVEDKRGMRTMLRTALEEDGWEVTEAGNTETALRELASATFDAVLTDVCLPGERDGLVVLSRTPPGTPVMLMTAYGTIDMAVEAMKAGARDYITKPFELADLLSRLSGLGTGSGHEMIGSDPVLLAVLRRADSAAACDLNVLVTGESGTGKELLVERIHRMSRRCAGAFIPVNCAAIPRDLLESELFGTEKGAYTGAFESRAGRFEMASGGTIFLDEIGDLDLTLQGKLLRVLSGSTFTRVGGTKQIRSEARVLAASNRDLLSLSRDGCFREDLYYRLSEFTINIPPLRDRRDDIPLLTAHFLAGRGELAPDTMETLMNCSWPGNVRQLRNILLRAAVLAEGNLITREMLEVPDEAARERSMLTESARVSREQELKMIHDALSRCDGNRSKAAKILGISYRTLLNRLKGHDQV